MAEGSRRRLAVDLSRAIYPEQGYRDVTPERMDDLTLLLYTYPNRNVGGYGFLLIGSLFMRGGHPVSITVPESLCGDPEDFPQLRYESFEEGFSALVEELRKENGDLELFLKPGVLSSIDGMKKLVGIVRGVPEHLFGEDGHEGIRKGLGWRDFNTPRGNIFNPEHWYNTASDEERVEMLKHGANYWSAVRYIANFISVTSNEIKDLRIEKEARQDAS